MEIEPTIRRANILLLTSAHKHAEKRTDGRADMHRTGRTA